MRENPIAINHNTHVDYNAADLANGGVHNKKLYPISGILVGNVIGDVREQLMDPDNMDFRPRPGSLYIENNVGPYNYEETKARYWIPGRREYKVKHGFSAFLAWLIPTNLFSCKFILFESSLVWRVFPIPAGIVPKEVCYF